MSCGCSGSSCNKCGCGYIGEMPEGFNFIDYSQEYEKREDGPGIDHPLVELCESDWNKSRLAAMGGKAVSDAGEVFLHKLPGMTKDEYSYYKKLARFPQLIRRVKLAIEAKVFECQDERGTELEYDNLDSDGLSFDAFERWCLNEVMDVLWGGILVDIIDGEPRLIRYRAENVRNWQHDKSGQISLLVLREYCQDSQNPFRHELTERRRVLRLQDDVYVVQVYELIENKEDEKKKQSSWRLITDEANSDFTIPTSRDGSPLRGIPFFPFGELTPGDSPLVPLRDVAEDLYNLDAWKKNIMREGCFPQKYINCTGDDENSPSGTYGEGVDWFGAPLANEDAGAGEIQFGTSRVIIGQNIEPGIMESTGASAKIVTEEQKRLAEEAYDYGTSIFRVRTQSNIASKTEQMQQGADRSLINAMARYVRGAIRPALNVAAEWASRDAPDYDLQVDSSLMDFELKDILNLRAGVDAEFFAREDVRAYLRAAKVINRSDEEIDESLEFEQFEELDLVS